MCLTLLVGGLAPACASDGASRVRFENRDPVWAVDDTRPMAQPPEREYLRNTMAFQTLLRKPVVDTLSVPAPRRAMNVNALGEVPDSTWFTNRIGRHPLTPEDVARGPGTGEGPARSEPLRVVRAKKGGAQPGFLVKDARGDLYILKFDGAKRPELETGADAVVQRLLWAVGYHVPEDHVIHFDRDDLVVAADATRDDALGQEVALTGEDLDETLALVPRSIDGARWRGLVSKFLDGVPVGGYAMAGTRPGDPNDRVPHEHRRDVRGQKVFFAWLAHTDVKEDNTLDMWVEHAPGSGRGHLIHYLVDFGKGLGAKGLGPNNVQDTYGYQLDARLALASLFTLGIWRRPWESAVTPDLRGVGRFDVEHFDPARFHTSLPWVPHWRMDRFDGFWAAKILVRLRREHIRAAVDQGRYSDPRTREYLEETLVGRQRKLARYWFGRVNPIDRLRVEEGPEGWRLCAADLLLAHALADVAGRTRYELSAWGWDGESLGWSRDMEAPPDGRVCVDGPPLPEVRDGYAIVSWTTRRGDEALPPTEVHVARARDDGRLRIVGIHRR